MTTLSAQPKTVEKSEANAPHLAFWGFDAQALHDRFWASRGVQVVRPGMLITREPGGKKAHHKQSPDKHHRGDFYLLLGEDDLVVFQLAPLLERFSWLKPRAMRLRLIEQEPEPYLEIVETDDQGFLTGIRRRYQSRSSATRQAWLTADGSIARKWALQENVVDARKAIKTRLKNEAIVPHTARARLFKINDDPRRIDLLLLVLQRLWQRPGATLDGVYEFSPGIWVHEQAMIAPGAQLVGPLWIGAGVKIDKDAVVIGPGGVSDDPSASISPLPIDWEFIRFASRSHFVGGGPVQTSRPGKRAFDIVFAASALLATSFVYPFVIAAIVREDGWPPFFAHMRQTTGGREFPCYKFRTMLRNAESMKEELAKANVCDGPQFHIDDDPRVLKVGKLLRKYHLDELPQFWNVLLGHMSVVGPRPSPDKENQFCPTWREARLSVRPGVTGLWQVQRTRKPENDFQEWIRYDLEYVQNQNWRLDLWIIFETIRKLFRKEE